VYLRVPNLPGQAPKLIAMFQADQHGTIQSLFDSGRAGGFAQLATEFVPQLQRSLTLFSAKLMQDVNGISMRNGTDAQAIFGFLSTSDTSGYLTNPDQDELTTLFAGDLSIRDVLERLDTNSSQFDATRFAAFQAIKNEVEPGLLKVVPSLGSGRFEGLQTTEAIASLEALRTPFARATADFTSSTAQTISTWKQAHGSNQVTESALADQKQSISGVNLDEEAANLVKYQQLYNASSKVMQTSRQMFDTLLAMLSGA
jgi:flagellar hook-associated protein FlgK